MDNENNILFEEEIRNNTNNRRNFIKFIISTILNIIIISGLILYSIKDRISDNIIQNKNDKNQKSNVNLRNLDHEDIFNRIERQIFYNSKNNIIENEVKKYLDMLLENLGGFDSLRDIISGKTYSLSKETYFLEKQKQIFLSRLIKNLYSGTWEYFPYIEEENRHSKNNISNITKFYYLNSTQNKFKIGSYKNGTVNFGFKKAIEMTTKKEALALTMKNLEGDYIDHWIQHTSYARMNDLIATIDEENKLYIVKGVFTTNLMKGQLFANRKKNKKNINKKITCGSFIELEFPLINVTLQTTLNDNSVILKNISTIDPSNFTMIISSACGFRIKIKGEIFDMKKDYSVTKKKVNYFSYLCIISSILYLVGASILTCSLNRNENAISGINLDCYCQNIAWHSYCGITNINFGLIYAEYFGNFCVIALFSLINFIIVDLRFLYFYWKIKRRVLNDRQFIRLRLRFFALFYGLLVLSFFSVSSFFMNWIYIAVLSFALWTPQIIHNAIHNNKYIYPTFYIFATTIDRMIYPYYFRGYGDNFFQLKNDIYFIFAFSLIILATIIILYLQAFLGPRFMLSKKYQKNNIEFYKTKEELLKERPDCIKEECVICISPLIETITNSGNFSNYDVIINNKESETENSPDSPTELKNENTSRDLTNRVEINNSQNKYILKNELHIFKNNKDLAINVKNNENHIRKNSDYSLKNILKIVKIIFCQNMFKFYKTEKNIGDKKYMIIACGHMFHTSCIEKWFDKKKECPNCRASMEEYL